MESDLLNNCMTLSLQHSCSGKYEPSWVKFKYGAWYLKPKMWKKRSADEPLMDPKELKEQEMSEAKKKSNDLVCKLTGDWKCLHLDLTFACFNLLHLLKFKLFFNFYILTGF